MLAGHVNTAYFYGRTIRIHELELFFYPKHLTLIGAVLKVGLEVKHRVSILNSNENLGFVVFR